MIRIIVSIFLIIALSGCATKTSVWYPDKDGRMIKVVEVKQDSPGAVTYKPETKEVIIDSRSPSWWQENIVPIFSGTIDRASRAR